MKPREERHLLVKYVELHPSEREAYVGGHKDAVLVASTGEMELTPGHKCTLATVEALRQAADLIEENVEEADA